MRTRPDSRRDYRHFPREYTDLLVRFEQSGRVILTFSEARQAHAARRELYRFKTFVSAGVDDDSTDTHARWLLDVFNTVTMRLETMHDGTSTCYGLVLDSNPLVRAMRASAAVPPEGSALAPSSGSHAEPDSTNVETAKPSLQSEAHERSTHVDALLERGSGVDGGPLADAYRPAVDATVLCPTPDACRSAFARAPAFCECGDSITPLMQEEGDTE